MFINKVIWSTLCGALDYSHNRRVHIPTTTYLQHTWGAVSCPFNNRLYEATYTQNLTDVYM